MQVVHVKLNPGLSWQTSFKKKKILSLPKFGPKFKKATRKILHLEHCIILC